MSTESNLEHQIQENRVRVLSTFSTFQEGLSQLLITPPTKPVLDNERLPVIVAENIKEINAKTHVRLGETPIRFDIRPLRLITVVLREATKDQAGLTFDQLGRLVYLDSKRAAGLTHNLVSFLKEIDSKVQGVNFKVEGVDELEGTDYEKNKDKVVVLVDKRPKDEPVVETQPKTGRQKIAEVTTAILSSDPRDLPPQGAIDLFVDAFEERYYRAGDDQVARIAPQSCFAVVERVLSAGDLDFEMSEEEWALYEVVREYIDDKKVSKDDLKHVLNQRFSVPRNSNRQPQVTNHRLRRKYLPRR